VAPPTAPGRHGALGHLPCLTPNALTPLHRIHGAYCTAFTPDAAHWGAIIPSGSTPAHLRSAYEADARRRHALLGAAVVENVDRRVRHDVDTLNDLAEAVGFGLGSKTRAVPARHHLTGVIHDVDLGPPSR
jgi:hypothetical protein